MRHYLKYRIWDLILCAAITTGLVVHIYSGFLLEDPLSDNIPRIVLVGAAVLFLCVICACHKILLGVGIAAGIVAMAGLGVYVRKYEVFQNETANSLCIALVILVLTAILVYLASRSRAGLIALFLSGTLVLAGSAFLQFPVKKWGMVLFCFSILLLYWYRNYCISLEKVHLATVKLPAFFSQTLLLSLAAFVAAGGIYMGVIRPLNLPTRELKLIIKLENMQRLQVLGVSSLKEILDPELQSNETPQEVSNGDQGESSGGNTAGQKDSTSNTTNEKKNTRESLEAQAIHYDLYHRNLPWLLIGIVAVLAGLFIAWKLQRKHWKKTVQSLSMENAVVNYYQCFSRALERTGKGRPAQHTLLEYAGNMQHEMQAFETGGSFFALTEIYVRVFYGGGTVTKEEYQSFETFYKVFYKNLRREIGMVRYLTHVLFL